MEKLNTYPWRRALLLVSVKFHAVCVQGGQTRCGDVSDEKSTLRAYDRTRNNDRRVAAAHHYDRGYVLVFFFPLSLFFFFYISRRNSTTAAAAAGERNFTRRAKSEKNKIINPVTPAPSHSARIRPTRVSRQRRRRPPLGFRSFFFFLLLSATGNDVFVLQIEGGGGREK